MQTKSSKSLSRKELLLEYSSLRELYELQRLELRAKQEQIVSLVNGSRAREETGTPDHASPSSDALIAIEANLKQQFEREKLELIEKLQRLHLINVRLVEEITQMQKAQQRVSLVNGENFGGAMSGTANSPNQSKQNNGIEPAIIERAV